MVFHRIRAYFKVVTLCYRFNFNFFIHRSVLCILDVLLMLSFIFHHCLPQLLSQCRLIHSLFLILLCMHIYLAWTGIWKITIPRIARKRWFGIISFSLYLTFYMKAINMISFKHTQNLLYRCIYFCWFKSRSLSLPISTYHSFI